MSLHVNQAIRDLLDQAAVQYSFLQHAPTPTSADAARERGLELRTGAKALVLKTNDTFRLFVLSAAQRLAAAALVKKRLGIKRLRFASAEELERLTGLVPGAVPPFGRPILPFDLYVNPGLLDNPLIAFNAGLLTESIILKAEDYVRVACPTLLSCAEEI